MLKPDLFGFRRFPVPVYCLLLLYIIPIFINRTQIKTGVNPVLKADGNSLPLLAARPPLTFFADVNNFPPEYRGGRGWFAVLINAAKQNPFFINIAYRQSRD